jgi:hypothetical protein
VQLSSQQQQSTVVGCEMLSKCLHPLFCYFRDRILITALLYTYCLRRCSLVSFFKELPVVLNKLKPTLLELAGSAADNVEQQLKLREWQETLVSLQHISNKYKVRTATQQAGYMACSWGSSTAAKQRLRTGTWCS